MKIQMSKIEKFKKNELQKTEIKSVFGGVNIIYIRDKNGNIIGERLGGPQTSMASPIDPNDPNNTVNNTSNSILP
jgi:hypothetical protein